MVFELPILDVAFAFLFLIPGYLSYICARVFGKITQEVDTYNKTLLSLLGSGSAIAITVVGISLVIGVSIETIAILDMSLTVLSAAYIGVLLIAVTQGIVVGVVIDQYFRADLHSRRERVWSMTFRNADEPMKVGVVTNDGMEIYGEVRAWDSVGHGKDILLKYPTRYPVGGNKELDGEFIGDHVLVDENDLSHIYFDSEVNID